LSGLNRTIHGFDASLIHPDFGNEPVGGKIVIGQAGLQFQSEQISYEISLLNLEVEFEDAGKGIFFFSPSQPDIRIFTLAQSILRHPAIRSRPDVASMVGRRELTRALRLTLYFVCGCLLAIWLGSLAVSGMTSVIVARIPMEWEKKLGTSEIEDLRKRGELMDASNDVAQLTALAAPLVRVLPEKRRDLKFYISGNPEPNAYALPGGYVVVNEGLLRLLDQPEEILGVLAHELAHQTKRHAIRHNVAAAGPLVIFGIFLHSGSRAGNLIALGSGLMVYQGFSQEYETEADDIGWNYLVAANIDPRGMIRSFEAFESLEQKEEKRPQSSQAFRSHPATAKRLARLEAKWDKLPRKSDFLTLPPVKWSFTNAVNN
jgi:beta-barrel assembly-enhancing protease